MISALVSPGKHHILELGGAACEFPAGGMLPPLAGGVVEGGTYGVTGVVLAFPGWMTAYPPVVCCTLAPGIWLATWAAVVGSA